MACLITDITFIWLSIYLYTRSDVTMSLLPVLQPFRLGSLDLFKRCVCRGSIPQKRVVGPTYKHRSCSVHDKPFPTIQMWMFTFYLILNTTFKQYNTMQVFSIYQAWYADTELLPSIWNYVPLTSRLADFDQLFWIQDQLCPLSLSTNKHFMT